MEANTFWKDFSDVDVDHFRSDPRVRKIPLYETNVYKEYQDKFAETLGSSRNTCKWRASVTPHNGSHSSEESYNNTLVDVNGFITTAYHIRSNYFYSLYEYTTGKPINSYDHIFEIGGGVGDFSKFVIDNGFKGTYTIIDLPEVMKVSKHNLQGYREEFITDTPGVIPPNSLLVSTWALSEIPIDNRNVHPCVFDGCLITFQREIFGADNGPYFEYWKGYRMPIPWIPWDGGTTFLAN
mgnify:CR=1 FL=1